jgi:hypothetical protein
MTLEPDGTAAACKAAFQWVRLPPASLTCQLPVQTTSLPDDDVRTFPSLEGQLTKCPTARWEYMTVLK